MPDSDAVNRHEYQRSYVDFERDSGWIEQILTRQSSVEALGRV